METTTIQVDKITLEMLKKLKQELGTQSYGEAIKKIMVKRVRDKSMAGSLGKYCPNYSTAKMVKEIQEERRKSDRL